MPRLGTEDGAASPAPENTVVARHRRPSITAPLAFWTDTMLAATATVVTLSVRLPQIAAGTMSGQPAAE